MDFDQSGPAQAAIDGGFGDYDSAGGRIDVTFPPTPKGGKPKSRGVDDPDTLSRPRRLYR
jgi:hypothetical protein